MQQEKSTSEIARLREQIAANYIAGQRAVYGLAQGTVRHDFITTRMEHMGTCLKNLATQVGSPLEAMKIYAQVLDQLPETEEEHDECSS